jgi:hypothetical protein
MASTISKDEGRAPSSGTARRPPQPSDPPCPDAKKKKLAMDDRESDDAEAGRVRFSDFVDPGWRGWEMRLPGLMGCEMSRFVKVNLKLDKSQFGVKL